MAPVEIPFAGSQRGIGRVMVGVSVAELVAVELLVPWRSVRIALLVLGLVCLVWVVWWVRRTGRRTHLVTAAGLVLRAPFRGELLVPWAAVERVTTGQKAEERDGVGQDGTTVWFAVSTTTNVALTLADGASPVTDDVRALAGLGEVRAVRFWADDPRAAVAAVEAARAASGA